MLVKCLGPGQMLQNCLLLFLLRNGKRGMYFSKFQKGASTQLGDICTFCFIIFK